MKRLLLSFAVLFLLLLPVQVLAYSSPGTPTGHVNDFATIISQPTEQSIENILTSLEASTSAQVAVVTIKSLGSDTLENYAIKLFEEWKIGQKGKDNGVLLLVAVNERKVRIEVGYGLEGSLTDAAASNIIRTVITPQFKEGNYDLGISLGVNSIARIISGEEYTVSQEASVKRSVAVDNFFNVLPFVIPLLLWFMSVLARSKSWWLGGVVGAVVGLLIWQVAGLIILGLLGLLLDLIVSRQYKKSAVTNSYPWWIGGNNGFGKGSSSGGFGGFSGGRSGGGGSSGSW